MDTNSVIAIAVVVMGFFGFTYVSMQEIFKFRLKKEQIKADTLVKTEEIKARNQLEIEALIHKETLNSSVNNYADQSAIHNSSRKTNSAISASDNIAINSASGTKQVNSTESIPEEDGILNERRNRLSERG